MNPSEVNESYTITAGVYTETDGVYVDTGKTLTFDSRAECQVWARDAQADGHSTGVHKHWNAAGDVYYDNVNRVFTWTEYGPELDAGTVEGLCVDKVDGVTKTIDETNYYQDKPNLYLRIVNIVTNDDSLPSAAPSSSDVPTSIPSESPSVSAEPSSQPSENPSISGVPSSQVSNIKHVLPLYSYTYTLDTKVVIHISRLSL